VNLTLITLSPSKSRGALPTLNGKRGSKCWGKQKRKWHVARCQSSLACTRGLLDLYSGHFSHFSKQNKIRWMHINHFVFLYRTPPKSHQDLQMTPFAFVQSIAKVNTISSSLGKFSVWGCAVCKPGKDISVTPGTRNWDKLAKEVSKTVPSKVKVRLNHATL
jgi:hypothetical protein